VGRSADREAGGWDADLARHREARGESIPAAAAAVVPAAATAAASPVTATAAATATITAAAAAVTITAAAARTRLAGSGLVHGETTPAVILIVKTTDGLLGLGIGVHLDESETFTTPCVTVGDHLSALDRPELGEELLKIRIVDLVGQVPDVQFLTHHQAPERKHVDPLADFPGREERGP